MNKIELVKELRRLDIPRDSYTLSGGLPNEKYCMEEFSGKWFVYYSERGHKTGLREFDSESDACEALLNELRGIPN